MTYWCWELRRRDLGKSFEGEKRLRFGGRALWWEGRADEGGVWVVDMVERGGGRSASFLEGSHMRSLGISLVEDLVLQVFAIVAIVRCCTRWRAWCRQACDVLTVAPTVNHC